jgi:hypothetical protein
VAAVSGEIDQVTSSSKHALTAPGYFLPDFREGHGARGVQQA